MNADPVESVQIWESR